ncbi:hypothetical protein RIF29_19507 [Crotalaria pallida]|uniref:Uncharacterized protein n=1 Tax=Crotalaria pallida TaxID=3830 RepID=A0AAN9F3X1_CROPI
MPHLPRMNKVIENDIADLKRYYCQDRDHIVTLLNDGESNIKSIVNVIDERVRRFDQSTIPNSIPERDAELEDHECRDVHISSQAKYVLESKRDGPSLLEAEAGGKGDVSDSDALALALQEKVSALLLLSQEEERHLLERNVNSALQRKIEDLQRNLLQTIWVEKKVRDTCAISGFFATILFSFLSFSFRDYFHPYPSPMKLI